LSVDERVVKVAKQYAAQRGTSVSRLVEEYLAVLSREGRSGKTPMARVQGILKGSRLDERDYRRHLRGRAAEAGLRPDHRPRACPERRAVGDLGAAARYQSLRRKGVLARGRRGRPSADRPRRYRAL